MKTSEYLEELRTQSAAAVTGTVSSCKKRTFQS